MMIRQNVSDRLTRVSQRMLIAFLLCMSATLSIAQVRDAFKLRGPNGLQGDPNTCIFSLHGDFTMIANVNLWVTGGNSSSDTQDRVNNSTNMARVDLDNISSTSNSSMSELKLYSSCSKIVYAGLYWTARTANSVSDASKKTVKIRGPLAGNTYTTLTAPMYSRTPGDDNQYVCFTDVTQYVKQQGVGQYWVADIALTEGLNSDIGNYAGWGMVVIYEDASLPMRNIAMFDGYAYVATGTNKFSIPVSGFKSVQTGPVKVKLGFMAGEGDAGYSGDWCQMRKATATGDVNNDNDWIHLENPTTPFASQNFWRSRVTNDAGAARNPNYTNNLGFDAFVFNADNTNNQFIGNNQTSTAIRYGTNLDQYIIFNMTLAVDAYEPEPEGINQVNTIGSTYVAQRTAAPGDVLTYKLSVTNQGNEAINNTKIEIPVPFNASYVANSITTTFDASLTGASATYDPAAQKIVVNLGTLPVPPTNNPDKVYATISYQLKATTDCYYLKNSNACLRDIGVQGTITGTGAITGVAVNKKTIAGFQGGTCAQTPITTPTTVSIVVPPTYTACDNYVVTTPNLRICPGTATSIPATTIRSMLTLPMGITYVFNSAADGSGTVYNDNNPFPKVSGTYYAVPVNNINTACSGSIPFTITILSVNTPPTVPVTSLSLCPSDLPRALVATATSPDYSIFWYTQATGGTASSSVTVAANTIPGTYTYYVAQGYDAGCQSSRVAVTVTVNPTPTMPSLTGPNVLCGGLDNIFSIVSPNAGYTYEWAMDNAPVGVAFKNNISTGTPVTLTTATTSAGAFTVKVRAKDNVTGCYSGYRTLVVSVTAKPATPSSFTGPIDVCEGSVGNIYTLTAPIGTNYEWTYSGTGYTWANGSSTTQSVELQFAIGATSGVLSVRAKTIDGCYSDAVTQAITVNPRPAEPASVSAANICVGQHTFINISNSNAALKYQVYSGTTPVGALTAGNGALLSIDIGAFATAGSFSYTVKSFNDKCYSTGQTPVSFTVLNIPAVPVLSSGVTTCYNTPPVIRVLNAVVGTIYNVYDDSNNLLNTVTATVTSLDITINDNPTATKIYRVTASNGICASQPASVQVIIRDQIAAPLLTTIDICAGQRASITITNPPLTGGLFDNVTYQYKVYGNSNGTDEIALLNAPEQISSTSLLLIPSRAISGNTTLYVRLVAYGCDGPLSPVNINIAPRPAPSVITPVTQCLGTRALITIHNTVKGFRYRVYDAPGGTLLRDIISLQSGDMIISISQDVVWTEGTIFYVQEAVRDDADANDICVSPYALVTMENGTPIAPSFTFNPAYTCSTTTATLTINNTLSNHTYNVYDSETGSTIITSVTPGAYVSQYQFNIPLPSGFSGTITYWMGLVENGSTCNSLRTPITITLATPNTPTLNNAALTVCRGSVPVITLTNAQKDVSYIVYDNTNNVVAGPVVAPVDGNLDIPILGLNLTAQQTYQYYVQAQAPALQNGCLSGQASFTLTDGEPVMPAVQNVTVCHGSPITVTIPNPVSGYTYLVYDANDNLAGVADASGNATLTDPNIPNPDYPDAFTNLNYYVKAQSASCLSEGSAPFVVRVNRTVVAGADFIVDAPVVCEHSDATFTLTILSDKLINSGDLTIKWYNNSNLTGLIDTQTVPAGTTTVNKVFSGLAADTYVYSVTAESALQGLCQNKPEDAVIATVVVKPHAEGVDISALDALICNGSSVILEIQLDNPAITNPVFNWYSDYNHTMLVASDTTIFSPVPNLTTTTSYYITVHNNDYCENPVGNDEWIEVTVNDPVLPPLVNIAGNATAICAGSDIILKVAPANADSISGYELWENGMLVQPASYSVDVADSLITVFAPSVGVHTYTVLSQFYQNNILCISDALAPTATVSVTVNDLVASPSITLDAASVCKGDTTIFHVTYTGVQPSDYILMNGTGEVDRSLYTVSSDMQTITLLQPVLGHHSYTLISLLATNGVTCQSLPSVAAEGDMYPRPTVVISNAGADTLCKGSQAELNLQLTGTPPFTYTIQAVDVNNQVNYIAQNAVTNNINIVLNPVPLVKTVYRVTALSDGYCNALASDLSSSATVDVYPDLQAGALLDNPVVCNNTSPGDLSVTFAFDGNISNYQYTWQVWSGNAFVDIQPAVSTPSYDPGVLTTGVYRYQRTVTDGCQTKTVETTITVRSDLQAGSLIVPVSICNNTSPGELSSTMPTGGNASGYIYSWYQLSGPLFNVATLVANTPTYTPANLTTGTYRYRRVVTDGCQTHTAETTITVYSDLTGGSLVAPKSICLENSFGELNSTLPTGGTASRYTYSWQLWDGSAFVNVSPAVATAIYNPGEPDRLGDYLFQRTVTDGCQTATASVHINVYSDLSPGTLVADITICNNTSPGNLSLQLAALCGSTSEVAYQWYSGDGNNSWIPISGATSADYNPGNLMNGIYYYQRTATDDITARSVQVAVTVLSDLQGGSLIAPVSICNNTSVGELSIDLPTGGNASRYSYTWQKFNGISFENISPAVTTATYNPGVLTTGTHRYQRTVTDGCQTHVTETTVTVYSDLNAGSLVANTTVCLNTSPGELNITLPTGGNASNYSYTWQVWSGTAFTDIVPTVTTPTYNPGTLSVLGDYIYQRTVTDGCQTATAIAHVGAFSDLNPGVLVADTAICNNTSPGNLNRQAATLCGSGSNITYRWYSGDGNNSWTPINGATSVDYNPGSLNSGVYHYQRTASDGTNIRTATVNIRVYDNLMPGTLFADMALCNNTSPGNLSLETASGGNASSYTYIWQQSADGVTFTNIAPAVTTANYNPGVLSAGMHYYRRIVVDGCQTTFQQVAVKVYDNLNAGSLINPVSLCLGATTGNLNQILPSGGNTSNYSYTWQTWNGNSYVDIYPPITTADYNPGVFTVPNTYLYQRTVTDGCQTATATVQIGVYSDLSPGALVADTAICNNTSPGNLSRQAANLCGGSTNITYQWYTGDGSNNWNIINSATGVDYNPGVLSSGTYHYQRSASDGTNTKSVQVTVTVFEDLQAENLVAPMAICSGTSPGELGLSILTTENTGRNSYIWQKFNGTSFENISPAVTTFSYNPGVLTSGIHRYQRKVTDGCQTRTVETVITVYDGLNAGSLIANKSVCLGNSPGELSATLPSGGNVSNYSYTWQIWNGTTFTDIVPAVTTPTYNPGVLDKLGNYLYQRTVSDGCQTATATVLLNVFSDLNPGALVADIAICNGTSPGNLSRQVASLCGSVANITYQWFTADAANNWTAISGATNVDYNPGSLSSGIYRYQRTVSDGTNTKSVNVTVSVFDNLISGKLVADISICNSTSPGNLGLQAASGGNISKYAYTWQLSTDGVTFTDISPAVATENYNPGILSAGTYYYRRTVTDGCQTAYQQVRISVHESLNGGSLVNTRSLCMGTPVGNLSQTLPSGGNTSSYTYSWQLWNGTAFADISPAVTAADYNPGMLTVPNTYLYQRTVSDGCQTATATVQIGVFSDLNPGTLAADTTICNGTSPGSLNRTSASLCGGAANLTYQWYTADASLNWTAISGAATADYNPSNLSTGSYQYQRRVSDGVSTQAINVTVTVLDNLTAGMLVADMTLCNQTSPGNLNIFPASGGNITKYAYTWQLSVDGVTFTDISPAVATDSYNPGILSAGIYYFRRTVTDGCQTASLQVKVVVFDDLSGGSLIAPKSVTPNTSPGNLSQVLPSGGNTSSYTHSWQMWNGSEYVGIVPAVIATDYDPGALAPDVYRYQRTVNDGCQTATAATEVTALANLNSGTLRGDTTICYNTSPGELSRTLASEGCSGIYAYTWQLSTDGVTFTDISPAVAMDSYNPGILSAGTYYYRRTVTDGCQTAYQQVRINVYGSLNGGSLVDALSLSTDTPVGNLSQTLPSGGNTSSYTYTWQLWNGSAYVDIVPAVTAADYNPGTLASNIYRYQRTVNDGCQTATAATEITALTNLDQGTLRGDTTICYNTSPGELSKTLASEGSSGTYTYTWQLWNGTEFVTIDAAGNSATYNPGNLASGTYRFRRTVTDDMSRETSEVTIVVHPVPEINAKLTSEGVKVPLGNPIYVTVTPDSYSIYEFTFNGKNTLQPTNTYAIHQWTPNANHLVSITVEDMNGCVNTLDMNFSGPPIDLPNIITPDNDGFNDNLLPGYNIEVFNRWGSRIYNGIDGWNGTYRGQPVASGTYFYIVHVTYPDGTTSDLKSYVFVKR